MSTIARRGTVGLAVAVAVLGLAPAAQAAVTSVFTGMPSPPVTCTVRSGGAADGQRWCSGVSTRVQSWDGTPIDVAVFLPPGFRVYAIDAEGNEQRKPTVKRFRVKARKRRR